MYLAVVVTKLVEWSSEDIRGPRFESSHSQNLYLTLFSVNGIESTKIKEKEAVNGLFFLKKCKWI